MKPNIIRIQWIDTTLHTEWRPMDDLRGVLPKECYSVGFELKGPDKKCIYLAQSYHSEGVADVLVIPRVLIRKIMKVKNG